MPGFSDEIQVSKVGSKGKETGSVLKLSEANLDV